MDESGDQYLNVRVVTPKTTLFQGTAFSLSSVNSAGRFDILPQHANFITLIENQSIDIRLTNKEVIHFKFTQAIIYNFKNNVSIFAEPLSS